METDDGHMPALVGKCFLVKMSYNPLLLHLHDTEPQYDYYQYYEMDYREDILDLILLALLTPNILRSSPGTRLTGHPPLVHHRAEFSVAQLVVLVPVILLEGGLHLVLTHPPASPDGSGDHFVLADVAVGVYIKSLG